MAVSILSTVPLLGNIAICSGHKLSRNSSHAEIVVDPVALAYLARKALQPWNLITT